MTPILFHRVFLCVSAKVNNLTSLAMDISNKSSTLLDDNKALVGGVQIKRKGSQRADERRRKGIQKWRMKTFKMAKAAYEKAKKAKESCG